MRRPEPATDCARLCENHGLAKHGCRHFGDDRIGDGDDRGRTRQAVDGRKLAEIFAVAKVAQDYFLAGDRLDQALREHRASPFITVFVNGLAGNTMYCDTPDGKYPVETVFMKELIPHIDATYRTIATRESRFAGEKGRACQALSGRFEFFAVFHSF